MAKSHPRASEHGAQDGRISRILDLIESAAPHRIADLAQELNLSESYLQHLCKKSLGVGLGQMLTERRLQKAASLLVLTNLRIKEIAAHVGYGHTSSFSRAFVQRFARTPLDYRAAHLQQPCSTDIQRVSLRRDIPKRRR